MDRTKIQWGDLVQNGKDGQVMFVSSPNLGPEHCWEGVRNGVYCIWTEDGEERWEIYDPKYLRALTRPPITDSTIQRYEIATQKAIESVKLLTMASFDMPKETQREKYLLAVSAIEIWVSVVGDVAVDNDRAYLEKIVDQNPIAQSEALKSDA